MHKISNEKQDNAHIAFNATTEQPNAMKRNKHVSLFWCCCCRRCVIAESECESNENISESNKHRTSLIISDGDGEWWDTHHCSCTKWNMYMYMYRWECNMCSYVFTFYGSNGWLHIIWTMNDSNGSSEIVRANEAIEVAGTNILSGSEQ